MGRGEADTTQPPRCCTGGGRCVPCFRRCLQRLRAWRPRVCEARGVWVAGAAQVLFNESGYYGPAKRVAATLQPSGVRSVQASREHVVLTRNE